jgi:hypothetical protein
MAASIGFNTMEMNRNLKESIGKMITNENSNADAILKKIMI